MLTERGLILNLPNKTEKTVEQIKQWDALEQCCAMLHAAEAKNTCSSIILCNIKHILLTYHLVRRSRASSGAGYRERLRISTETTEEEGFFSMNVFTWNKWKQIFSVGFTLMSNFFFNTYTISKSHYVLPTLLSLTGVAPKSRGRDVSTGSLGHLSRQKVLHY